MSSPRLPAKCFYKKGQGELQIKFLPLWVNDQGNAYPGCLMLEIAKAFEGSDKSDWANKITMKINDIDCAQILKDGPKPDGAKIFHKSMKDGIDRQSTLIFKPAQEGTYRLDVYYEERGGQNKKSAGIFLSDKDFLIISNILYSSIPSMYGI